MPIPSNTQKIRRPTVREEVYPTLQEWIVTGVLKPGEKVLDKEIAETLGVSRTPIREALQRLIDEGLVETARNSWTRVAPVDLESAERIYPIMGALEPLAASLALPHVTHEDVQEMERSNAAIERALMDETPLDASVADRRFHRVLAERSGNPELVGILDDLIVKLRRLEIAYFGGSATATTSVREHDAILAAIRSRDADGAATALTTHWREGLARVRKQAERLNLHA